MEMVLLSTHKLTLESGKKGPLAESLSSFMKTERQNSRLRIVSTASQVPLDFDLSKSQDYSLPFLNTPFRLKAPGPVQKKVKVNRSKSKPKRKESRKFRFQGFSDFQDVRNWENLRGSPTTPRDLPYI